MNTRSRLARSGIRTAIAACLAAAVPFVFAGCGEGGSEINDVAGADDSGTGTDIVEWDPGSGGTGCGGYGYGYRPDRRPDGALDSTQAPCIFGTCELAAGVGTCVCLEGYDGRICGECAQGWVVRGLRCVRVDACHGFPCAFGTCRIVNTQPFCDCDTGYAGDHCDACADGFIPKNLRCVLEEE